MNSKKIFVLALLASLTACEKKYTCECTNPGGVYATYELNKSKIKAEKSCKKYNDEANTVPMSESSCALK